MNQNSILLAKILGALSLVSIVCGVIVDFRPAAQPITWSTLIEAKKLAASSGKQILIDVYAPWCQPCRQMDEAVFSDPPVKEKMQAEYVLARCNTEDPETAKLMREVFEIEYLPTFLVLSPRGKELKRAKGFRASDQFLQWLKDASYQYIAAWKSYDEARSLSNEQRKPLLLLVALKSDYTSTWNINMPFENEVLRSIVDQNFVATVLVEHNPANKKNLEQLKIAPLQEYPLLLLFAPDGKELGRIEMTYDLSSNRKLLDWARSFLKQ